MQLLMAVALLSTCRPFAQDSERTVWLSLLDLTKATQGWGSPQRDKSVDRHPITLKGRVFDHGFGTHSPGLLTVSVNGAKRFRAIVGVDDEVGAKGSVEFEVLDMRHQILWRSGILRGGNEPKQLSLDLAGQKEITLRVTTGGDGFDYDHADWADARFEVVGLSPEAIPLISTEPRISMVGPPAKPQIHPPYVLSIRAGTPFLWTVPCTGKRPISFSVQGLPPGFSVNPSNGIVTGQSPTPSRSVLTVSASNVEGSDKARVVMNLGDDLVATPPMGWNSYDCFGDDVTEEEVLANAKYLAAKMQPYGWDTVVVDYRWYDPGASEAPNNTGARAGAALSMDSYGRLLPAPNRFPSGFKGIADAIHAMGLKFGIHIMRGIPRNAVKANLPIEGSDFKAVDAGNVNDPCPWCPDMFGVKGDTPAGQAYYDSIFRLYASWGVDYVKMDDTSSPYHRDEIEAVHNAILKCGRSIVYSLSPGETPIEDGDHVRGHANLWRVSGDFWDNWGSLSHAFTLGARWGKFPGPGHWPDADMLPLGHISVHGRSVGPDRHSQFTKAEQTSLMSLWALLPSPLMLGANMPDNDPWTLALLTNPEVLAVNQDALSSPGAPSTQKEDSQIWMKHLADGSYAVGIFNLDDFDQSMSVNATGLGFQGDWRVRDLWLRRDLGNLSSLRSFVVPSHGVLLVQLKKVK